MYNAIWENIRNEIFYIISTFRYSRALTVAKYPARRYLELLYFRAKSDKKYLLLVEGKLTFISFFGQNCLSLNIPGNFLKHIEAFT